jgi:hypothetical protein
MLRQIALIRRTQEAGISQPPAVLSSRGIVFFLCIAVGSLLSGCGGNNNLTLQNQPAPASTDVSITFSPAPTESLSLAGSTSFTAVVHNDPSNAGVDWALLCPAGATCGTLTPLHTASGKPATYTPPATITGNSQSVTIEAFASADHGSNVVTSLTITGFDANLKGNYVFATRGFDENGAYQLAGVITLDGNGNVTGGEQTHNDALISVADAITGGIYTVGPDGRGTMTLDTADQNIGQLGIENLAFVVISNSKALIGTLDNPNLPQPSFELSSGTLELQSSTAAPTGGYAFVMNGIDIGTNSMALGGILNIDSPNAISGNGSTADQDDAATGVPSPGLSLTGTLTKPDSFGSLKFNLTLGATGSSSGNPLQFTGYVVDTSHIKLIESDNAGNGAGFGVTAGVAIGQGSAAGKFTNSSFAGNYAFDIVGQDPSGVTNSLALFGQFFADANGNLNNGYNDEILSGFSVITGNPLAISDSFTATYTLDALGAGGLSIGRVDTGSSYTFGTATNGPGPELIFYLTGNGNPPLILDEDDNPNSLAIGSIGIGFAHPQAAPPYSFNGDYGVKFGQSSFTTENTATGAVIVKASAGTLNGTIDENQFENEAFFPQPGQSFTGTFGAIPNTGRFTGTLNDPLQLTGPFATAFYPVSSSQILFIETDIATSGISSFGYFETRTPACPICP